MLVRCFSPGQETCVANANETACAVKIEFFRWRGRHGERLAASPPTREPKGELTMHFRVYDLAADQCVWSIPPIDTVPMKLRVQKLVVRATNNDGGVVEVALIDGDELTDLAPRFLADPRVVRLKIHLAADDFYAGRVIRHDNR